jgi:hypothetical protein
MEVVGEGIGWVVRCRVNFGRRRRRGGRNSLWRSEVGHITK